MVDLFNVGNRNTSLRLPPLTHLQALQKIPVVSGETLFNKVSMITFIRIIAMGNVGLVLMKILPFGLVRNQISTNNNIKERCLFGGGCYMFTIFFRAGLLLLLMF